MRRSARFSLLLIALLLTAGWAAPGEARSPAAKRAAYAALLPRLQEAGTLRLIVQLNVGFAPEGRLSARTPLV